MKAKTTLLPFYRSKHQLLNYLGIFISVKIAGTRYIYQSCHTRTLFDLPEMFKYLPLRKL